MNKQDVQKRLILLSDRIDELTHSNPVFHTRPSLKDQIDRASTSAACHYGEAIGAESAKDFVHKLSIVEKELRETWALLYRLSLRLISDNAVHQMLNETDELIRIVYTSKRTANLRLAEEKSRRVEK
jgi:four helix bundle protein